MPLPNPESSHFTSRPGPGTKTRRVWEIADEITKRLGRRATRREVLERYVGEEGGEPTTCSTTYSNWKSSFDAHADVSESFHEDASPFKPAAHETALSEDEFVQLTVAPDGRLLIPARLREAMRLGPDGRVTAYLAEGELRVVSPMASIRRVQRLAQHYKKPGQSVVDEFLAERRAMWGEE